MAKKKEALDEGEDEVEVHPSAAAKSIKELHADPGWQDKRRRYLVSIYGEAKGERLFAQEKQAGKFG